MCAAASSGRDDDDDSTLWCADGDEPNSVPWHRIDPRYEATEEDAVEDGALLELLSPAWRILLLSDGSVTRHLRLLCPRLRQTRLECLRQGPVPSPSETGASASRLGMPNDCDLIDGPMVQREVLLHISRGDFFADDHYLDAELNDGELAKDGDVPMVYAASWWSSDDFRRYMVDGSSPMWSNLRSGNVELYREVRRVYMGDNEELAAIFGCEGPFWGRHYIFWHDQKPMTVVYEVFNPALERQLGPAKPGVEYL